MHRLVAIALAVLFGCVAPAAGQDRIVLDARQLRIAFEVETFGFWTVSGVFERSRGEITFDGKAPGSGRIVVVADATSISTKSESLDRRLKSEAFFDVTRHPTLTFESTGITFAGSKTAVVAGTLRMLGVTRPITLDLVLRNPQKRGLAIPWAMTGSFRATGAVRRSQWGMTAMIPAIGDDVRLAIEADLGD
jgi:polyisoprenoid-binding protein YceI